jgi:hypothetical protein
MAAMCHLHPQTKAAINYQKVVSEGCFVLDPNGFDFIDI